MVCEKISRNGLWLLDIHCVYFVTFSASIYLHMYFYLLVYLFLFTRELFHPFYLLVILFKFYYFVAICAES